MIEAINRIGRARLGKVLNEDEILECFLEDVSRSSEKEDKDGQKLHVVTLDFNTFDRKVEVDSEEIKENETAREYMWLGNLKGNKSQIYSTTKKIDYLLSQVIPNLIGILPDESNLSRRLRRAISSLFCDVERSGRNKYVFNIERLGIEEAETEKFCNLKNEAVKLKKALETEEELAVSAKKEISSRLSQVVKEMLKEAVARVDDFIHRRLSLRKKDIDLYTLRIDGELVAKDEDYRKVAYDEKIKSLFEEKEGNCSLCNDNRRITDRPQFAGKALGYYITDKIGFSSELSGDFTKSLTLCEDCYKSLLCGEVFVRNSLRSRIGRIDVYIIPKFLFSGGMSQENLDKWAGYLNYSFNSVKSLQGLKTFQEKIEEYIYFEDQKNKFFLDILFYRARKSEFKILKLIKDVPPSRFERLIRIANEMKDCGDKMLGESDRWHLGLQNIYYLIPLRETRSGAETRIEYRKILDLYGALFSSEPVSYHNLINEFIELARVYRFKKFETYNIRRTDNPDKEMAYALLRASLLLLYLKKLKLLKGGNKDMNYDSLGINEEMKSFLREMGYDEAKTAMFFLGCLIGEVGKAQYREGKSKPILDKITYQGMNRNKLIRLTNDVFEKLTQYKSGGKPLLHYANSEAIFSECRKLMDRAIDKPLSDQENVFFVLSGYAYSTHSAIKGSS